MSSAAHVRYGVKAFAFEPIEMPTSLVVCGLDSLRRLFAESGREVTDCDNEVVLPIHSLMAAWSAVKAIS